MPPRITAYTRHRMRQRHLPEWIVLQVFDGRDGVEADIVSTVPDREIRWRLYAAQRVEIVVDMTDDTIVSAWATRVNE